PQQAQITVTVADENGNPHPNASVRLTLTTPQGGPTGTLTSSSGVTDGQGKFVVTYHSPSQVPSLQSDRTGRVQISANATTTRNETAQGQKQLVILPGPPALLTLTSDRNFVPANQTATLTAIVVDANGNKVRDGIIVAFRIISAPSDVQITPLDNGQVRDGRAEAELRAGNTSGRAVVEAVAEQVENGNSFVASAQITVNVATTQPPVVVDLSVSPDKIVVSDSNSIDPAQRNPLDPSRTNRAQAIVTVNDEQSGRAVEGILVVVRVERAGNVDSNVLLVSGQNRGQGEIQVATDSNGRAQVEIYSSMSAGQVTVKASIDPTFPANRTRERQIEFEPGIPTLTLALDREKVRLEERADVTVAIKDANGNPFAGQQVQVQVDEGSLADGNRVGNSLTVTTGSDGTKTIAYHPPQTLPASRQATITAQAMVNNVNLNASKTVQLLPGVPSVIELIANPAGLPNNGQSVSVITATVKDRFGNLVEDGVIVEFSLTRRLGADDTKFLPTLQDRVETVTVNGQAHANLRAGSQPGVVDIVAQAGSAQSPQISVVIGITLVAVNVAQPNIFVSRSDYSSFGANYPNTTTVTVKVADANNNPVANVPVKLSSSDNKVMFQWGNNQSQGSIDVVTDNNGQAQVKYIASQTAGQVTVTATFGNQTQSATVTQQPGPPTVTVDAVPEKVFVKLTDGQYSQLPQQAQITVTVADENGNPHPNASVQLT
ncbi:MAG: Ig-like domain-containing protein, partial [Armatimonadota bacterium]